MEDVTPKVEQGAQEGVPAQQIEKKSCEKDANKKPAED
jgi:hypothetical protein